MKRLRTRLYLLTPPHFALEDFAALLERTLDAGDVAALQLRMKAKDDEALDDRDILEAARRLMPIAHRAGAAFLINDRPDLAARTGADGAHIGQDDTPYDEARRILGPKAMIGVTAHNSRHLAMEAAEAGADYVAFGAFFPTTTKETKVRADLDLIRWWADIMTVPCVAIGGITPENAMPLIEAGADFLAVASGVWDYPDGPEAALRALNHLLAQR